MSTLFLSNNKILGCLYYYDNKSKNVTDNILDFIKRKKESFLVNGKTFNFYPSKDKDKKNRLEILTEKHILTIYDNISCYIVYDDLVINKYNNELYDFYRDKNINIFGKGPTFKNIKCNENDINVCVNSTINFVDECDIFTFNDMETLDQINFKKLNNVKYIFIPEYLHHKGKKNVKNIWFNVHLKIKDHFKGKYILFNLYDTPLKNHQILNIDSGYSSALTFSEYLIKYNYIYIKKINYYGIGISDRLYYNKIFKKNTLWNENNIKLIRNKLLHLVKKYNMECKFN